MAGVVFLYTQTSWATLDKLCHTRSVAYSAELVLLNKHQILDGGSYLDCYHVLVRSVLGPKCPYTLSNLKHSARIESDRSVLTAEFVAPNLPAKFTKLHTNVSHIYLQSATQSKWTDVMILQLTLFSVYTENQLVFCSETESSGNTSELGLGQVFMTVDDIRDIEYLWKWLFPTFD